ATFYRILRVALAFIGVFLTCSALLGHWASVWFLASSLAAFIPAIFVLNRTGKQVPARLLFLAAMSLSIYGISLIHRHGGEFGGYSLVLMVTGFMLFGTKSCKLTLVSFGIALATRGLIFFKVIPSFFYRWGFPVPVHHDFGLSSFLGPYMLIVVFLMVQSRETEKRRNRMLAEKTRLEKFFETSPELMCILDSEFRFTRVNQDSIATLGYRLEEMQGVRSLDLVHPDDQDEARVELSSIGLKGGLKGVRIRIRRRDGQYRMFRCSVTLNPVTGEIYAVGTDITEMEEQSEQLRERTRFLETILFNLPVTILVKDFQKHSGRYTLVNRVGETLLGIPASALIGRTIEEVAPPEISKKISEQEERIMRSGKSEIVEQEEVLTPGGERKIIWKRKIPTLDENGKPALLITIAKDITEKVKVCEALEKERIRNIQNAKMATIGELSAGIAHEINNPLAILSGALQTLPRFRDQPARFETRLVQMESAVHRIGRIVTGLRKFSRSSEFSHQEVHDLGVILDEVLVLTELKAKSHDVRVQIADTCSALVMCNEIQIQQVFINLVNNAIDAVKSLPERWVRIRLFRERGRVCVQIRDSGGGIPHAVADRIFEPYFTTKPSGEGTGIGLSIVKGLLDEHGASIRLLPNDDHTCFELVFMESASSGALKFAMYS
ncbi:MAG: PAS domain S-box protein, partial [Proteobacteria bacterium]|nr:PAS domain S-box protein [Pseudomonadota bacterium]